MEEIHNRQLKRLIRDPAGLGESTHYDDRYRGYYWYWDFSECWVGASFFLLLPFPSIPHLLSNVVVLNVERDGGGSSRQYP